MKKFNFYFGCQFEEWCLEICLPDRFVFQDKKTAQDICREMLLSIVLFQNDIVVLLEKEAVFLKDGDYIKFTRLKRDVYERMGPPLSGDDIDELIEQDELEEVLFSEKYYTTDADYEDMELSISEAYQELSKNYGPKKQLPFGLGHASLKGQYGFEFGSLYYRVEEI